MHAAQVSPGGASPCRRAAAAAIAILAALAGTLAAASPAAAMVLKFDNAKPGKYLWASGIPMQYRFELAGAKTRDVRIEVIQARTGKLRKAWRRNGVRPDVRYRVKWNAKLNNGNPAPMGNYFFRVREVDGQVASRRRAHRVRISMVRHNRFPMHYAVGWGDGWGAGRGHRGQDLFAPCGRRILAARAGRVVWRGYQAGGAGYYLVVRGRRDNFDYVYMHLRKAIPVKEGDVVRTGQWIGRNGDTGNASGCHLHFEVWREKWFAGGRPLPAVTKLLRRWHRWG